MESGCRRGWASRYEALETKAENTFRIMFSGTFFFFFLSHKLQSPGMAQHKSIRREIDIWGLEFGEQKLAVLSGWEG